MTLTKNEITAQITELGFPKKKSNEITDTLLELIKRTLESGENVLVSGFGKFQVKDKSPRRGRNPGTGEDLMIDGRKVVTFKCSGKLRERVNGAE